METHHRRATRISLAEGLEDATRADLDGGKGAEIRAVGCELAQTFSPESALLQGTHIQQLVCPTLALIVGHNRDIQAAQVLVAFLYRCCDD